MALSFEDKVRLDQGVHSIHHLTSRTDKGEALHFYISVLPSRTEEFFEALKKPGIVLNDYGTLVAGYVGDAPDEAVVKFMKDEYNIDITAKNAA